jgi:hypothetical protein
MPLSTGGLYVPVNGSVEHECWFINTLPEEDIGGYALDMMLDVEFRGGFFLQKHLQFPTD